MISGCLSPCEKDHFAIAPGVPSCQEDNRLAIYKLISQIIEELMMGMNKFQNFTLCRLVQRIATFIPAVPHLVLHGPARDLLNSIFTHISQSQYAQISMKP